MNKNILKKYSGLLIAVIIVIPPTITTGIITEKTNTPSISQKSNDLPLSEDFSIGVPPFGWRVTHSNWRSSDTNYSGGASPEAVFYWYPNVIDNFSLYTYKPIDTSFYNQGIITFKQKLYHYNYGYTLKIQTSTDGTSWTDAWSLQPTSNFEAEIIVVPLNSSNGIGSSNFYLSFTFSGDSYLIDYWYIDDVTFIAKSNNPPDTPFINGKINGKVGVEYEYTFLSVDPEDDDISYFIDWGDGLTTGWTRLLSSKQSLNSLHIWSESGSYTIKAKAKDIYGTESDWSDPLVVTMHRKRGINTELLNFLQQYSLLYLLFQQYLRI